MPAAGAGEGCKVWGSVPEARGRGPASGRALERRSVGGRNPACAPRPGFGLVLAGAVLRSAAVEARGEQPWGAGTGQGGGCSRRSPALWPGSLPAGLVASQTRSSVRLGCECCSGTQAAGEFPFWQQLRLCWHTGTVKLHLRLRNNKFSNYLGCFLLY